MVTVCQFLYPISCVTSVYLPNQSNHIPSAAYFLKYLQLTLPIFPLNKDPWYIDSLLEVDGSPLDITVLQDLKAGTCEEICKLLLGEVVTPENKILLKLSVDCIGIESYEATALLILVSFYGTARTGLAFLHERL